MVLLLDIFIDLKIFENNLKNILFKTCFYRFLYINEEIVNALLVLVCSGKSL